MNSIVSSCDQPYIQLDDSYTPLIKSVMSGIIESVQEILGANPNIPKEIRHQIAHIAFDQYTENMNANFHYLAIVKLLDDKWL